MDEYEVCAVCYGLITSYLVLEKNHAARKTTQSIGKNTFFIGSSHVNSWLSNWTAAAGCRYSVHVASEWHQTGCFLCHVDVILGHFCWRTHYGSNGEESIEFVLETPVRHHIWVHLSLCFWYVWKRNSVKEPLLQYMGHQCWNQISSCLHHFGRNRCWMLLSVLVLYDFLCYEEYKRKESLSSNHESTTAQILLGCYLPVPFSDDGHPCVCSVHCGLLHHVSVERGRMEMGRWRS